MPHIQRTPEARRRFLDNRGKLEVRKALHRHTEAVATLALREEVERRLNPRAYEMAQWKKSVLANLSRPRSKRKPN